MKTKHLTGISKLFLVIVCGFLLLLESVNAQQNMGRQQDSAAVKSNEPTEKKTTTGTGVKTAVTQSRGDGTGNSNLADDSYKACEKSFKDALKDYNDGKMESVIQKAKTGLNLIRKSPDQFLQQDNGTLMFKVFKLTIKNYKDLDNTIKAKQLEEELIKLAGSKFGNDKDKVLQKLNDTTL